MTDIAARTNGQQEAPVGDPLVVEVDPGPPAQAVEEQAVEAAPVPAPPPAEEAPAKRGRAGRRAARQRQLTTAEKRQQALETCRQTPDIGDDELAAMYGMSARWARDRKKEAREARGAAAVPADLPEAEEPSDADEPVDDRLEPAARERMSAAELAEADVVRTVKRIAAVLIAFVTLAPVAMSFHSLADYAGESLGLTDFWPFVFAAAVDAAAVACVALTFDAVLSGDGSAGPRTLLWALVAGSSILNYRHGQSISPDAGPVYAAMPIVGAILIDLLLRRLRRGVLRKLGVVEEPLARYRLARWITTPGETFGAWKTSVRENVSHPGDALALYRSTHETRSTRRKRPAGELVEAPPVEVDAAQ